ncbi:unknown [Clostridium sp. CAG:575]|nr:unknown [Clostridium sp. CAG:575]
MNKKHIIILIIISIIIILLTGSILFLLKKSNNNDSIPEISDVGEDIDYSSTNEKIVTDKIEYYTVRNCINNYLNALNKESSIYYFGNEYNKDAQIENVYSLLSSKFISQQNITQSNLFSIIKTIDEEEIFIPLEMKVLEKENINQYVVYGEIQTLNNKFISKSFIIVNLDMKNKTYSIEPVIDNYNSIDDITLNNENIAINKNDYNMYKNQNITNEYVTNEYFVLLKRLMLSDPDMAYTLMKEEYKNSRFGNINEFRNYINNNRQEILKIDMKQYLVNNYENYIEYVAKDQFGNLYIFDENEDKSIDIKFDTYTLKSEVFTNKYIKSTDEEKVQMNIDKFIQMINRHDYRTSYNCIADSFKNNYFKTQEEFQNYIENNFYSYNKFEFKSCEKKAADIYVCKVQLTDYMNENSEIKEINVIMQLGDNLDFKMSFGM